MIYNIFRFFALALLLAFVVIKDIKVPAVIKNPQMQLYIAVAIVLFIILVDNITGFILGLAMLVLYFKMYNKELQEKKADSQKVNKADNVRCILDNVDKKETYVQEPIAKKSNSSEIEYISMQHLLSAQNNIVDVDNYDKELIGFGCMEKDICNNKIYGSQGLDNEHIHIKGMDHSVAYLGSLMYSIIE